MSLFHKVYAFRIPFSTCLFTINTARTDALVLPTVRHSAPG